MDRFNNEISIVLVGKTGTGKSSTGNTILNCKEFRAECQGLAVTAKSSFGTRILNGRKLIVVDTPGFLDTHRDREKMRTEISRSVGIFVPGPHAFLFVMRIGDRLTDDDQNCIKIFTEMFGEQVFKYVIVVFTRGKDLDGKPLIQYCQEAPVLIRNLLAKCSNRMIAFDNNGTNFEKTEAVDTLLGMIDNMIYVQTYYSNDILLSAKVAFMRRVDELGQVNAVRREIENGGTAFETVMLALGLVGVFFTGYWIAGQTDVAEKVGIAAVVAVTAEATVAAIGSNLNL